MSLKTLISGALVSQHSTVADFQLDVLVPLNAKLQNLTVLSLECNVIGVAMMMVTVAVMMVCFSSLIHNCGGYSQYQ